MLAIGRDSLDRFHELTVADVMNREVAVIPWYAGMNEAADILSTAAVSGAPVVDDMGRCIGVLSTTDFLRLEASRADASPSAPEWCDELRTMLQPANSVQRFMSTAVQTVTPTTPLLLAGQIMCAEHIHRVIVLDERSTPVGVVSTLDIISAIVSAADEHRSRCECSK